MEQFRQSPSVEESSEKYGHLVFFLFGPLFFYYAKALTDPNFHLNVKDTRHGILFFVVLAFYSVLAQFHDSSQFVHFFNMVVPWVMMVQMLVYFVKVVRILQKHTLNIRDNFSSLEKINLRWLRTLIIVQIVIWPIAFMIEIFKTSSQEMNVMWLLVSVFIYLVGYYEIRQPEIFIGQMKEEDGSDQFGKKKYQKSTLSNEQADLVLKNLAVLMTTEKPFLDSNLTLPVLSKKLSVSTHHLSQVMNERLRQNFFDYINQFRVEEAKRLIKDPQHQHLTLAAIGFEAGFNSVSSFNAIFKKVTSQTPSRYRFSLI